MQPGRTAFPGASTQEVVHLLTRSFESTWAFLPITAVVRGILAAPGTDAPAAMTLERLGLEFQEIQALPAAREAAAQPGLF